MRIFRSILIGAVLGTLASCAMLLKDTRPIPKYNGVDPKAEPIVDEWLSLAEVYGLKFDKSVSVGFMDIDTDGVVGECNYALYFREIDLDRIYWQSFTNTRRMATLFHELTHCYCDRSHDYAAGKEYDNSPKNWRSSPGNGFFTDGCPTSIMYPYVAEDDCFTKHYGEYVEDMFSRCEPY